MVPPASARSVEIERYRLHDEIASGGMGTVHLGRLVAPGGFARTVAIKRLHRHLAKDPDVVAMFLDEARLAARVRHPNVVSTLDVVSADGEFLLVMEYVHGLALSELLNRLAGIGGRIPIDVLAAIVSGLLQGLHAAHEATDERGEPLAIVHRDVSPQNVLVGVDGIVRVLDFGIAKAAHRLHTTQDGAVRGKLRYMAPEQFRGDAVDRRSDVFSAGVVFWELLTGRRLFENDAVAAGAAQSGAAIAPPSTLAPGVPASFDAIALRALSHAPGDRFESAFAMALAIEDAAEKIAGATRVAAWLTDVCEERVRALAARIHDLESGECLGPVTADVVLPPSGDRTRIIPVSPALAAAAPARAARTRRASRFGYAMIAAGTIAILAATGATFALRGGERTAGAAVTPMASAAASVATHATTGEAAPTVTATATASASTSASASTLPRAGGRVHSSKRAAPQPASSAKHLYERPW